MPKFTFEKIRAITAGQHKILQLQIDGKRQFDSFETELKGTDYEIEYAQLTSWLDYYCKTGIIANGRLKELQRNKKDPIKEFEFRTTNLRFYAIQGVTGKIIILCGYKKNQKEELKKFRALKKQIFHTSTKQR